MQLGSSPITQGASAAQQRNQSAPSGAAAPPSVSGQSGAADTNKTNTVDFQNFLTLLTTQLRNQDPLSPLDSADFVAQLASFSSVEQLVGANDRLDSIASALGGGGIEQYANWIGRDAEVQSPLAYNDGVSPVPFRVSTEANATQINVTVTDLSDLVVTNFTALNTPGAQQWDGLVNGVPAQAGAYNFSVSYLDSNGEIIRTETPNTFGVVKEVRLANGAPVLVLDGGVPVDPDSVIALRDQN